MATDIVFSRTILIGEERYSANLYNSIYGKKAQETWELIVYEEVDFKFKISAGTGQGTNAKIKYKIVDDSTNQIVVDEVVQTSYSATEKEFITHIPVGTYTLTYTVSNVQYNTSTQFTYTIPTYIW